MQSHRDPAPNGYGCPVCNLTFTARAHVRRHFLQHHSTAAYNAVDWRKTKRICPTCFRTFDSVEARGRHQYYHRHFGPFRTPCSYCHLRFTSEEGLARHLNETHLRNFRQTVAAYGGQLFQFERTFELGTVLTPEQLRSENYVLLQNLLEGLLHRFNSVEALVTVHARFAKLADDGTIEEMFTAAMTTKKTLYLRMMPSLLHSGLKNAFTAFSERVDTMESRGSGYKLMDITGLKLRGSKRTFAGGCRTSESGRQFLKLNSKQRDALRDVPPERENECLFSAIAQAYVGDDDDDDLAFQRTKVIVNNMLKRGEYGGRRVYVDELRGVERLNKKTLNFGLNVYMCSPRTDSGEFGQKRMGKGPLVFYPVHLVAQPEKASKIINLLLLGDRSKPDRMHYVYVRDLAQLVLPPNQVARGATVCHLCLNAVHTLRKERHMLRCIRSKGQKVLMPELEEDGSPPRLTFTDCKKRYYSPIVCYVDFESSNSYRKPVDPLCENVEDPEAPQDVPVFPPSLERLEGEALMEHMARGRSGTEVVAEQLPITYTLLFVANNNVLLEKRTHSSDTNLMQHFVDDLVECYDKYKPLLNDRPDMGPVRDALTPAQRRHFLTAEKCWICDKPFVDSADGTENDGQDRVLDHSHSSLQEHDAYLGPAHRSCNSARQHQTQISVYVHNLNSYDGTFLIKALLENIDPDEGWDVSAIPLNSEKFISFTYGKYVFLDSLNFMRGSLSQLVDNAVAADYPFPLLDGLQVGRLRGSVREERRLMLAKGVYPYRVATSARQVRGITSLPDQASFYSDLAEEHLSDEDYAFAEDFWQRSGCENLLQYTEFYCELDTILLASCVSFYREMIYNEFSLDASQYLTSPHLGYSLLTLQNVQRVDLLTDSTMFEFIEEGIRGGVSHAATRYASVPENCKEDEPPTLIMLDAVNLYGYCMMQKLPAHTFEWEPDSELVKYTEEFCLSQTDEQADGFIASVDLEYPAELEPAHSSFPLAPTRLKVTEDMLSPYTQHCRRLLAEVEGTSPRFGEEERLAGTFGGREDYVVHYRALKLYLKLGMKLKRVRRVLKFQQSDWIGRFVKRLTEKRQAAVTKFEQDIWKAIINATFGKTMQNLRKQQVVHFVHSSEDYERVRDQCDWDTFTHFGGDLTAFYVKKKRIYMNRPFFAGMAILDIAKEKMYDLFYNEIQSRFPDAEVCLTDTDSLAILSKATSKKRFLDEMEHVMDFSNYPADHPRYSKKLHMVPGMLKDEGKSLQLAELAALKAKCYCLRTEGQPLVSKAKGAKKSKVKRDLTMEMYKSCIFSVNRLRMSSYRLQTKSFRMYLLKTRKIAMSSVDLKRYVLPCAIHTLPYHSTYVAEGGTACPQCHVTVEDMRNSLYLHEYVE